MRKTKHSAESADRAADNAAIAASIRRRGLLLLDSMIDDFAQYMSTEHREVSSGVTDIKRLRDITAVLKDLTDDLPVPDAGEDALARAREILGGVESAID